MPELLRLESVSRRFGGLQALQDVSLEIGRGEVLGLIGPNGAGKTTLVNVITGVHRASSGRVLYEGRDITRFHPYQTARAGLARGHPISLHRHASRNPHSRQRLRLRQLSAWRCRQWPDQYAEAYGGYRGGVSG